MSDWIHDLAAAFAKRCRQEAEMQEENFFLQHNGYVMRYILEHEQTEQVIASECDIADELVAVIAIQYDERDPLIHTDALPYCWDMTCPCHGCTTWAQVEEMIDSLGKPFDAGLLTSQEQDRLWQGRQV